MDKQATVINHRRLTSQREHSSCLIRLFTSTGVHAGAIADYLRSSFSRHDARIFSDDSTVWALLRNPSERFLSSADARVIVRIAGKILSKGCGVSGFVDRQPHTRKLSRSNTGTGNEMFRPIMHASQVLTADIGFIEFIVNS